MRRLAALVVFFSVPLALACKKPEAGGDGGADAAPSASAADTSAAPSASASASATATATVHRGPAAPGAPCAPGVDTTACAPGGLEEMACQGGVWRVTQMCRGPAQCKGVGGGLVCDVGNLTVGDPCIPSTAPAKCARRQALQQCTGGKWTESLCVPPAFCQGNPPACGK